jgi:predicted amidohydrolase YtcJ
MNGRSAIGFAFLALGLSCPCLGAEDQRTVIIHAGQLFDGKSDRLVSNQVIVIQGDRIAEVGPAGSVRIPAGAQDIDLSSATVLPGLIEGHNHMFKIGDYPGTGSDAAVPAVIRPATPFPRVISHCWRRRTRSSTSSRALPRRAICRAAARST